MAGPRHVEGRLPFRGLLVVELCDTPAGECVGKLLADLGAEVVKVEPPEGARSRRQGPYLDGADDDPDSSLAFWAYNTSKRSVAVDDANRGSVLEKLLGRADVVLNTAAPRELAAAGVDYDEWLERYERLIVVSVTPFGLTGPWRDYRSSELIGLAAGGPLWSCGYDDHEIPPILPGGHQASQLAASFAYSALLLALIDRHRGGKGQLVDVSMHEACAVSGELANPYWFYPKALVQRQTCRHAQPVRTQPALFQCADGAWVYFALVLADARSWKSLVDWLDAADLAVDLTEPGYHELSHRQANFAHIQGVLDTFFLLQDSETAYREGQERGLPIGPLRAFEELAADEHLRARKFFVDVPAGERTITLPGLPYRFSGFRAEPGPAPRLGEHTDTLR